MSVQTIIDTYAPLAGLSRHVAEPVASQTTLALAPMAGVTGASYRIINRLGGCELAYSEMISCAGLMHASKKSKRMMVAHEIEPNLVVQLFGSDVEQFRQSVSIVLDTTQDKLAGIDINMACPVKKVVSKGEGAALLEAPEKAYAIVSAVRETLPNHLPVSVKARLGRYPSVSAPASFYEGLFLAGASEVAIHGRFASEFYHGDSRKDQVLALAQTLSGNVALTGDMLSAKTVKHYIDTHAFSKILIARGSYGNPWLASDARLDSQKTHGVLERLAAFELLLRLMAELGEELGRARMYASHYLRGFSGASVARNVAMRCVKVEDYIELIERIRGQHG